MKKITKTGGSVLLAALVVMGGASGAQAYGPEGLFGGRPMPDSSIVLGNPVELRNDRPERAENVLEHPRPDYDGVPYQIGGFELFPTLELGETYDSNIYVEPNSRSTDAVGTVRPIVNLFSNWGRHALSLTTFGDINFYSQHADENYKNLVVDVNGRYDILDQMWVSGRGGYQRLAESRTSPNAVNGSEPTTFGVAKGGLTFYRGIGILKFNADYDYKRFDYDETPSALGPIDQSNRNRDEHVMGGKLAYDMTGNFKPYIRGAYNIRSYDDNAAHDSEGFYTVAGVNADLGGITSIDVYGGWMEQYYDDFTAKKKISSPRFGARVDWNVTGMTSVVFEVDRTIEETTLDGYNSFYQTGGSVTVTHELLRNVLLEGNVAYSNSHFNGVGDRVDELLATGLGVRYLINRSLYTDVLYTWDRRFSTEDAVEYGRHMGTVRLGINF